MVQALQGAFLMDPALAAGGGGQGALNSVVPPQPSASRRGRDRVGRSLLPHFTRGETEAQRGTDLAQHHTARGHRALPQTPASCLPCRAVPWPRRCPQAQASPLLMEELHGNRAHPGWAAGLPSEGGRHRPGRHPPLPRHPHTPLPGLATLEAPGVTCFPHFPLSFKTNQNADQHPLFVLGDQRKGKAALWVCS